MATKAYCMQNQHFVEEDKITYLTLPNGNRRRMCEDCKSDALDRRKAERDRRAKQTELTQR